MAILDFRGFSESAQISDYFNYGGVTPLLNSAPANLFIGTNGTFGDNYLALVNQETFTVSAQINWPTPTLNPFFGIRTTLKVISNQNPLARYAFVLMDASGNGQVTVSISAVDGSIKVFNGRATLIVNGAFPSNVTQIASAPAGTFLPNISRYLEIGAIISSVGGAVTVRLDGNVVINVTGVSTISNGAAPAITTMLFENSSAYSGAPGGSSALVLQHMYVLDNTGPAPLNSFLGDVRVSGLGYAAISGTAAFTAVGAATNTAVCATTPPLPNTVRNISNTVGDTDTYTVQPLPPSTTAVFAVGVRTLAARDAAGTRSLTNKLTSGATTAAGTVISLGISPVYVRDNFGADPATGAAWTVTAVNALKPGYTS